jgi:hypothetical protein
LSSSQPITLTIDRRLLEHPRALHLRRVRAGVWLYLVLLSKLPAGKDTLDIEPEAVGRSMGLSEGTVRSWLGHLRKSGYLEAEHLNGVTRVRLKAVATLTEERPRGSDQLPRFFTPEKLEDALGEQGHRLALEAAMRLHADRAIRQALAGALAVPATKIRRSRTALFLYLLKHDTHAQDN